MAIELTKVDTTGAYKKDEQKPNYFNPNMYGTSMSEKNNRKDANGVDLALTNVVPEGAGYIATHSVPKSEVINTPTYDYSGVVEALARMSSEKYGALKDALLANRQKADDIANNNYQRNLRQWNKTYNGNAGRLNGAGLSNKFNLMANRDSAIRQNESDYLNNLATVQSGKYDDASNLLRGISNPDQNTINALLKYYI